MPIHVLGALEVTAGASRLPLGGQTARLLLAVLVAHRRRVVPTEVLSDALWGESPPVTARATLQTHLSKLRRTLAPLGGTAIVHRPPGYVLEVDRTLVDADRFEDGLERARSCVRSDRERAGAQLDQALAEWRGPAFAEFATEPWAQPEAVRLEELRLVALEERIETRLATGDRTVVAELEALTAEHPLRERLWGQLMVALHRAGRQGESLRAAQSLRAVLAEELGLEPSLELRELEAAIARDDPSLRLDQASEKPTSSSGRPGAPPAPGTRSEIPCAATALVGREADLVRLAELLPTEHLLTLTGTGGVGKSSLAYELARRSESGFRDGARVVELAAVSDDSEVLAAAASSLDVERRPGRSLEQSVVEVLGPTETLLVIDNCEHVTGAVGSLVREILRWCPETRVVATSREALGLSGETVWPVRPLAVPLDPDAPVAELIDIPAVQVFRSRARAASPTFELDEITGPAVAELCTRLDGLPLALELAAARMGSMGPRQLADRLEQHLDLLGAGTAREPRHRTLLDVVDWSYDLLSPPERTLFERLSVFAGDFELEAAEQTCSGAGLAAADVVTALTALVAKSLVVAEQAGPVVRYRILETLRQRGADHLAAHPEAEQRVRRAHLRTYVELAERGAAALDGPAESAWMARLDRSADNLRAAARAAIADRDADAALRLAVAIREFAFRRIRYEVVGWAEAASALPGAEHHPLLPTALAIGAYGSFVRGELDRAVELARQALEAGQRLGVASSGLAERTLANALFYQGHPGEALEWIDAMVDAATASGNAGQIAHGRYMQSVAQTSVGNPGAGPELAERAAEAAASAGSDTARSQAAYAKGLALVATGSAAGRAAAVPLLDEAARLAEAAGNRWMRAFALTEAHWLRAQRGEVAEALRGYREVVETWYRGGDWANQWLSLRQLAGILVTVGRDREAAMLLGAVDAAEATTALPFAPVDAQEVRELAEALTERLGTEVAAEARRRGRALRDDAAVAVALEAIDDVVAASTNRTHLVVAPSR